MALDVDQLKTLRRQVGDQPDDDALNEVYDRVGTLTATAREILEIRLANLTATPASFAVPGEYSQSTDANIKALTAKLADIGDLDNEDTDDDGDAVVRIVRPERTRIR